MFRRLLLIAAICVPTTLFVLAQEPNFSFTSSRGRSEYNANNPVDYTPGYNKLDARAIDPAAMLPAPTPADAVAYALADIATLSKADQPFQRYVWVPTGNKRLNSAVNFTVNVAWNRATVLVRPRSIAQGRLVRLDLRTLAPRADIVGKDFTEIHQLWEKLASEPYFHITRTSDDALPTNAKLIKSLPDDPPGSLRFNHDDQLWYKSPSGKTYCFNSGEWQSQKVIFAKKTDVSVAAFHVGLDQHVMLQGLTQSNVPIVRYDYLITRSLQTLNGGLYYDLIGLERNPKGQTAQQAFFAKFGISQEEVAKQRSDQRVAMFKSKVTGRPRRVDFFRGTGVRPDSGTGLATITFDIAEEDVGPESDPIRNLLEFKDKAREAIVERANGMQVYALFNNKGELQDSAPDNVVKDHTIPAPYPARLQPGVSCIRCHGNADGWQPVANEVRLMLSGYLNVFDDLSDKRGIIPDILDRLAGLYAGDLAKPLRRARDDYSDAVYNVTGGLSVPQASSSIAGVFLDYMYTDVDASIAMRELGYEVPPDKAVYYLNLVLPQLARDAANIAPEDPILGALKVGLKVQRYQWEAVYADAAFRSIQTKIAREKATKK